MMAKGHMLLASAITLSVEYIEPDLIENEAIFFPFMILGSLLPDIDEKNSYIGRRLGAISIFFDSIFEHRTFTHYLFLPVMIFIAGYFVSDMTAKTILYALATGILLHDVGDMLTKGGINGFFYPFYKKKKIALLPRFLRFYTNSVTEYFLTMVLIAINTYMLLALYL